MLQLIIESIIARLSSTLSDIGIANTNAYKGNVTYKALARTGQIKPLLIENIEKICRILSRATEDIVSD